MKILILNDSHIRGKNSQHYIGDYYSDCLTQLDETIELSKKCDMVIHAGDVWDSPYVSNLIIDEFIDKVEHSNIPWYVLPGNHDMIGANWQTSSGSALAHTFRRSKSIKILDEEDWSDTNENLFIKGYPYYFRIEEDIKNKGLICPQDAKVKIAVTHAFLTLKPFHPQVLHTEIKDIECNYDIVICSHFHHNWGVYTNKNTQWLNLGAWGRLSITEANHIPNVAIVDTEDSSITVIPLKSAKKGSEIFDLEKREQIRSFEGQIDSFINELKDISVQSLDLKGIVEDLGKKNNIEREVVDIIINKLNTLEKV